MKIKNKSQATQEAEKRIKENKQKETKDMSKFSKVKTVAKYVATIVVTLTVVFAGYQLYMQGYNHGANDQKKVNAEIVKQVAQLKPAEK